MCLAIPGRVTALEDSDGIRTGRVEFGGIIKRVCLEYTPEAEVGDYVLVHVGFAISKVEPEEAARTFKVLEELGQLSELDAPQDES